MKKLIYSIAAMLPMFAACNKAQAPVQQEEGVFVTIPVGFAADSKTVYNPDTDGKCSWVAGDKVATKFVAEGNQFTSIYWYGDTDGVQIAADGTATVSAYFGWSDKNKNGKLYAAYPWNGTTSNSASNWERSGAGVITMPSEQNPTAVSFDPLADVMTSQAIDDMSADSNKTETLLFRHRVGFMALSFTNVPADVAEDFVKTVTITAKEGAALAGKLAIAEPEENGDLKLTVQEGTNSIVLNYAADIKLSELVAYACVLPGTFETLAFDVELKSGASVSFAQRNVNVTIAEGMMIHPSVAYNEAKGDTFKAKPAPATTYTLTITPSGTGIAAVTTDTTVSDAISEFGLSGSLSLTTKFGLCSNSKPIGSQICSFAVTANAYHKYALSSSELSAGTTKDNTYTVTEIADGVKYFAVSTYYTGSAAKPTITKCNISQIVITYTK